MLSTLYEMENLTGGPPNTEMNSPDRRQKASNVTGGIEELAEAAFASAGLRQEEEMSMPEFRDWMVQHPPAVRFMDGIKRAGYNQFGLRPQVSIITIYGRITLDSTPLSSDPDRSM